MKINTCIFPFCSFYMHFNDNHLANNFPERPDSISFKCCLQTRLLHLRIRMQKRVISEWKVQLRYISRINSTWPVLSGNISDGAEKYPRATLKSILFSHLLCSSILEIRKGRAWVTRQGSMDCSFYSLNWMRNWCIFLFTNWRKNQFWFDMTGKSWSCKKLTHFKPLSCFMSLAYITRGGGTRLGICYVCAAHDERTLWGKSQKAPTIGAKFM